MMLRIYTIFSFLTFLSCGVGTSDEEYEKLIIGKWHLDSIHNVNNEKQSTGVFLPFLTFNTEGQARYWGIEDHQNVFSYSINGSIITYDSLATQTDSIMLLNETNLVLFQKISARNMDGSAFLQTDTYYYSRIE